MAKEIEKECFNHVDRLLNNLSIDDEQKEHKQVATLFGSNQKFDKNCKVLIGTSAKIGTGFDFDKLDTLLLAADVVEYYIQFIGRIMRKDDVNPIIFDLVDNNKTLQKHYSERLKVYKKHGGIVKNYKP